MFRLTPPPLGGWIPPRRRSVPAVVMERFGKQPPRRGPRPFGSSVRGVWEAKEDPSRV